MQETQWHLHHDVMHIGSAAWDRERSTAGFLFFPQKWKIFCKIDLSALQYENKTQMGQDKQDSVDLQEERSGWESWLSLLGAWAGSCFAVGPTCKKHPQKGDETRPHRKDLQKGEEPTKNNPVQDSELLRKTPEVIRQCVHSAQIIHSLSQLYYPHGIYRLLCSIWLEICGFAFLEKTFHLLW